VIAVTYHRLLAYKDEYEVARLYTNGAFKKQLEAQFEGDYKVLFHLAPPLLARRDKRTKELKKRTYGSWVMGAFKILAAMKGLRGTAFDLFGYTLERRMERLLITEFEDLVDFALSKLSLTTYKTACTILEKPQFIRGYGHVKEKNLATIRQEIEKLKHQCS
jgi:indolepyruvate ferredoxin oxidoreductase